MKLPAKRSSDLFDEIENYMRSFWDFPAYEDFDVRTPLVDVEDKKDKIIVSAEIPGVDKKDISVDIEDNRLIIKAERNEEKKSKKKNYYKYERNYSSFYRVIPLEAKVDENNAMAEYKNGVLTITLPKKGKVKKAKKIKVK